MLSDETDVAGVHDLGDDGQARFAADGIENFEAFLPQTLKIVRRGARLKSPPSQSRSARFFELVGESYERIEIFDGAWARDSRSVRATKNALAELDDCRIVVLQRHPEARPVWRKHRTDAIKCARLVSKRVLRKAFV